MEQGPAGDTSSIRFEGTGPGARAADGSSVDLYLLLKPQGEPAVVRKRLAPGDSILELGCGVGRITGPLVQMGYAVVAVDNSEDMLAFVKGAKTVKANIETLDLGREFDGVLLMSHLINFPDVSARRALLATCRRHVAPHGIVIIQRYDPKWLEDVQVGSLGTLDGIEAFVDSVLHNESTVEMTLRWRTTKATWTQRFVAQSLDDREMKRCLDDAELELENWLDDRRTWLSARGR